MKLTIRQLRSVIRQELVEWGGGPTRPPTLLSPASPDNASQREEIGSLGGELKDTDDELPPHLREPVYDEDECWGPVPPTAPDPTATMDPFNTDWSVLPTPSIKRG